jgi:hypothetical protein
MDVSRSRGVVMTTSGEENRAAHVILATHVITPHAPTPN